ncbi:hypothetical protein KEJ26_03935 [Candidatus Bathyarchaeota archaeon]|nr:hypothetical protein [Candidatus Bathyarchaeota archaeon]
MPRFSAFTFPPKGHRKDQVIYWINRANVSIHILIYDFDLYSIGDALINAHNRGVDVNIVFEGKETDHYSEYQRLRAAGVQLDN